MADIDNLIELYEQHKFMYGRFLDNVHSFFLHEPSLNQPPLPVIHSLKWRLKDPEHLRDKLQRKLERGDEINEQNLFEKITDFAGIQDTYYTHFIEIQALGYHLRTNQKICLSRREIGDQSLVGISGTGCI